MPVQLTTVSHSMSPALVRTPVTRGRAPSVRVMTSPTVTPSTMRTPRLRAPRASDMVRSTGLTRPSPGTWKPAMRPSMSACGKSSAISRGPISSTSSPRRRWKVATRRYSSSRSAVTHRLDDAHRTEARGQPGLGLEPGEEVARVQADAGQGLARRPEAGHQPGRVPGRAAGQAVALDEHDVGDPLVGEVVGDRGADDPATDDDDAGAGGELRRGTHTRRLPTHGARPAQNWPRGAAIAAPLVTICALTAPGGPRAQA